MRKKNLFSFLLLLFACRVQKIFLFSLKKEFLNVVLVELLMAIFTAVASYRKTKKTSEEAFIFQKYTFNVLTRLKSCASKILYVNTCIIIIPTFFTYSRYLIRKKFFLSTFHHISAFLEVYTVATASSNIKSLTKISLNI